MSVAVVDIGLGNIASVANMCRRLGYSAEELKDPSRAEAFDQVVLPGVGSFDTGVRGLKESGWWDYLVAPPAHQQVLGICLGMQLLATTSEEGNLQGLNLIPAHFERFVPADGTVPHMGWNSTQVVRDCQVFDATDEAHRFYFTHSYFGVCEDDSDVVAWTTHGRRFVSAYARGNVAGVQFHPEKSHRFGKHLFRHFLEAPCFSIA